MLTAGLEKLLAASVIALGGVGGAAATALPSGDAPVIALSLASLSSIFVGSFWYGRLTERVKAQQEVTTRLEIAVKALQDEQVDERLVDRMAQSLERLSLAVERINTKLGIAHHDEPNSPYHQR